MGSFCNLGHWFETNKEHYDLQNMFSYSKKGKKKRMGKNLIFITSEWWHIGPLVIYSKTEAEEQVYNVWGFLFVCLLSRGILLLVQGYSGSK